MSTNYLNNKDLLKEIHKSKLSYCSFTDKKYEDYDFIVHSVDEIMDNIEDAIDARIQRLAKIQLDAYNETAPKGQRKRIDEFIQEQHNVSIHDVVFRVMTRDHLPLDIKRTKRAIVNELGDDIVNEHIDHEYEYDDDEFLELIERSFDDHEEYPVHVRVNFPAFQHWIISPTTNEPVCVGKSHWRGDLETGEFCQTHGQITDKLATMYTMLCARYASRSNWRGYTYNDEMQSHALLSLVQSGLQFDESKSSNPFAYFTTITTNAFTRILNTEKRNQNIRDDLLEMNGLTPSFTRQMANDK